MAAPRIKFYFENGALGLVSPNADGVLGLLCTGATVGSTFVLGTPYVLRGMDSLQALGVTAINNESLYKLLSDFYGEAGNGTELWLMAFADTVKLSEMVDPNSNVRAKALINAANGRLRGLIVSRTPAAGYTPTVTNGLDSDVALAQTNAETLAVWAEDSKYAPLFVLLEGYGYSGTATALTDQTLGSTEHVSIVIGNTETQLSATAVPAAMGLVGGRVAKNPIQQNIAAVADGPVNTITAYIGDKKVEEADWETIHDKGYITFRTYSGRSGYFFVDDPTTTLATDDYSHLTAVRTVQKAFRIAYNSLLEKLVAAVPVNADGTLQTSLIKGWQAEVENAIARDMTANGELSADLSNPNDKGVQCFIDPAQNVASTSKVVIRIRVRPFAYARFIDVYLGFQVVS